MTPRIVLTGIAATIAAAATLSFGEPSATQRGFMSEAAAVRGRPATPMSYAGVARRTTRRAVAVGAAAATTVYPVPACVQVVNAYGQVVVRCP